MPSSTRHLHGGEPQGEVEYFNRPNATIVRAALRLGVAAEAGRGIARLGRSGRASNGRRICKPLTELIVARYLDFFPKQTYPIRTGVHPNTAFGLAFAYDYARGGGRREVATLVEERAKILLRRGWDVPAKWEPGGDDFFSPSLMEADLMRRVLPAEEFRNWFAHS